MMKLFARMFSTDAHSKQRPGASERFRCRFERLEPRAMLSANYATGVEYTNADMSPAAGILSAEHVSGESWQSNGAAYYSGPTTSSSKLNSAFEQPYDMSPSHVGGGVVNNSAEYSRVYQTYYVAPAPRWSPFVHVYVITIRSPQPNAGGIASHWDASALTNPVGAQQVQAPPKAAATMPSPSLVVAPPKTSDMSAFAGLIEPATGSSTASSAAQLRLASRATTVYESANRAAALLSIASASSATAGATSADQSNSILMSRAQTALDVDGFINSDGLSPLEKAFSTFGALESEREAVRRILSQLDDVSVAAPTRNTKPAASRSDLQADQIGNEGVAASPMQSMLIGDAADDMIMLQAVGDANESGILLASISGGFEILLERRGVDATVGVHQVFDIAADETAATNDAPVHGTPVIPLPETGGGKTTAQAAEEPNLQRAAAAVGMVGFMGLLLRRRHEEKSNPEATPNRTGKKNAKIG